MSKYGNQRIKAQTLQDLLRVIEAKVVETRKNYNICELPSKDAEDYISKMQHRSQQRGRYWQMEELQEELKEVVYKEMSKLLEMPYE
jgi:hypothetical protein